MEKDLYMQWGLYAQLPARVEGCHSKLPYSKGTKFKVSKKKYKIKELLLKNIFHHQKLACLLLSLKRWNKTKTLLLDCNMDFFWGSSFFLRDHTVPNWSGFYDLVFSWKLSWKIKCGFSTYRRPKSEWFFVHLHHTKSLNVETPVITFD